MNDKLYLVNYSIPIYGDYSVTHAHCSTMKIAEEKKQELLLKIQNVKTHYFLQYDTTFEDDKKLIRETYYTLSSDEYNKICERVYIAEHEHRELLFENIEIQETKLY